MYLKGILAQESSRRKRADGGQESFIRSTYVDWVKSAGARAVPIWYTKKF